MSEFKIHGTIAKAYQGADGKMFIEGVASGTQLDLDGERMATSAIEAFKRAIDDGIFHYDGQWSRVPLRSGHRGEWDDVLGWIVEASVDASYNFHIVAELDGDNPQACNLYKKLTKPAEHGKTLRLGFSIGGMVISAGEEWVDDLQRYVYTFYDVALREVSVTSMPAYAQSYVNVLQRSVDWTKVKGRGRVTLVDPNAIEWENDGMDETTKNTTQPEGEEAVEETAKTTEVAENDAEVTEETAKSAETEAEVEETAKTADEAEVDETDPFVVVRSEIAQLTSALGELAKTVSGMMQNTAETVEAETSEEAVAKSESQEQVSTDAPAEATTEKAAESAGATSTAETEVDIVATVASAVEAAVKNAVEPLQARIAELEAEPVDKSVAVTGTTDADVDPLTAFKSLASEKNLTGREALSAALSAAVR